MDTDGSLLLIGRYRSGGRFPYRNTGRDSRQRIDTLWFNRWRPDFDRSLSWDKAALSSVGVDVLSIEGGCLPKQQGEYRLYVSTEKKISVPG